MDVGFYLKTIKVFLDEIPQFISDIEPDDNYLLVPGTNFWKSLVDYTVDLNSAETGFVVSGCLKLLMEDAKQLPEWDKYASENPELSDDAIYDLVAHERPSISVSFDLEEFCSYYEEVYLDFLDENGLDPDLIEIDGDSIQVVMD